MEDGLYRDVTDFPHETPGWVHTPAELGTASRLLLLAALLCAACVGKLRRTGAYERAAALSTPPRSPLAYGATRRKAPAVPVT